MSFRQDILNTTVAELPLRPLPTVPLDATVCEAVIMMQSQALGAVVVLDAACHAAGMFNEKLLIRLLATNPAALHDPVQMHMARDVATVTGGHSFVYLIEQMQERQLRWAVVVDDHNVPIALTGVRSVIEFIVEHFPHMVRVHPIISKVAIREREGA